VLLPHLQRASNAADLLSYLCGPGEHGTHTNPRLVAGDGHGFPIEQLVRAGSLPSGSLPYLAHVLDSPAELLWTGASEHPIWLCSVHSDPGRPDLTDAQWATVARRLVSATGIAPDGDPDACRWIALRNHPRQVHVVAALAREDGSVHNTYRDAFRVQTECHRLTAELGHLTTASPRTPRPLKETQVPASSISITAEPSGSVLAKGARDELSALLLKHAGFQQIDDWYGRRHRLPTTTPAADRTAIATSAAEMLRAARYSVDLDPALNTTLPSTQPVQANPLGPYTAGGEILAVTDRIRGAESGEELRQAVGHLLHPEHGALERVREALEAVSEQINDLDSRKYRLADRFGDAADLVHAAQSELAETGAELGRIAPRLQSRAASRTHSPVLADTRSTALAPSPAAAKAKDSSALGPGAGDAGAAVRPPQAPGSRTR